MKDIMLAGGSGTRLHPMTLAVSKQMLPVYDRPMTYFPLATLMKAGSQEVLIISAPADLRMFQRLLGDGARWGLELHCAEQLRPEGLGQAYQIGADFVQSAPSAPMLGDDVFHGTGLSALMREARARPKGASVFGYRVADPERFGVVEFDDAGRPPSIEEKPKSHGGGHKPVFLRRPGGDHAAEVKPSPRGELEITDVNRTYLERGELSVARMPRHGVARQLHPRQPDRGRQPCPRPRQPAGRAYLPSRGDRPSRTAGSVPTSSPAWAASGESQTERTVRCPMTAAESHYLEGLFRLVLSTSWARAAIVITSSGWRKEMQTAQTSLPDTMSTRDFTAHDRILVSGGPGFIGSAVVRQLIADTLVRVLNLDKLTYAGCLTILNAMGASPCLFTAAATTSATGSTPKTMAVRWC